MGLIINPYVFASGGGTPPPCTDFTDDFADGTIGGPWTIDVLEGGNNTSVTIAETGGQLQITIPANPGGSMFRGVMTGLVHDIANGHFAAKVVQVVTGTVHDTTLSAGIDSDNWMRLICEDGSLYFQKKVASVVTTFGSVTYNASTHLYWRLRHTSGTMYWETSPDNLTWTTHHSEAYPLTTTSVFYCLNAGAYTNTTAASTTAIFDDVCAD